MIFRRDASAVLRLLLAAWVALLILWDARAQNVSDRTPDYRYVARTPPLSPAEQQEKFHLPPGFRIELVAAEPRVRKPINLNFDARGRLLATTSVEYPEPARDGAPGRDAIRIFTDADRDGVFEKAETFAGGLHIPIGVTPVPHGVMAYSIASIDRFDDRDGDGRSERRRTAYGGFGSEDPHGMANALTWWIDGWIYACHGEANRSVVAGADGEAVTLQGGNTFRMRPDGSHIEQFTHGQANPFGLCFDPLGDAYAADSHSKPASLLLPGAWYPSLGAPHDGLGFGPIIMRHYHGSTGIAGIVYYAANQFPSPYRNTLFLGNPVTGRINRDRLEAHGSSYRAIEQPDFLTCDDPWFRPVDLQLGPDGALYIADFYNCFIGRYMDATVQQKRDRERGRIWRVVYGGRGSAARSRAAPADLSRANADQLIACLSDPNLTRRTLATHELAERVRDADRVREAILRPCDPWRRAHGLWVLHRLGALDDDLLSRWVNDPSRIVRVHAVRALAERRNWNVAGSDLRRMAIHKLSDSDAMVRRVAAEALARHPARANLRPLLDLWSKTPRDDTLLIHSVRMALRNALAESGDIVAAAQPFLSRSEDFERLADVSLGIRTAPAGEFLFHYVREHPEDSPRFESFLHHAARFLPLSQLPDLHRFALTYRDKDEETQSRVLRPLYRGAQERGVPLPAAISQWGRGLGRRLLTSGREELLFSGVGLAWDLKLTTLRGELAALAKGTGQDPALRSFAMDALGAVDPPGAPAVLGALLRDSREPMEVRRKAADALGKIRTPSSRAALDERLVDAPTRLAVAIAQALAFDREGCDLLLEAIDQGKATAQLLQDPVVDQRVRASGTPDVDGRIARALRGLPSADERLRRLIDQRREGYSDAQRDLQVGADLFDKNCGICHRIGDQGAQIGPPLDGIGQRGLERLLEDTLDPSRTVAGDYRSSVLQLADGRVLSGLVVREEDGGVVLADAEGREQRIALSDIEQRRRSVLSPMPADVALKLSEADYYRLLSYLLSQRQIPESPAPDDAGSP